MCSKWSRYLITGGEFCFILVNRCISRDQVVGIFSLSLAVLRFQIASKNSGRTESDREMRCSHHDQHTL